MEVEVLSCPCLTIECIQKLRKLSLLFSSLGYLIFELENCLAIPPHQVNAKNVSLRLTASCWNLAEDWWPLVSWYCTDIHREALCSSQPIRRSVYFDASAAMQIPFFCTSTQTRRALSCLRPSSWKSLPMPCVMFRFTQISLRVKRAAPLRGRPYLKRANLSGLIHV